ESAPERLCQSHICPRHPWAAKHLSCREVIKRLVAYQLHRNLTSPWFSPGCPHCVIPEGSCGWTEVSLCLFLSSPYRELPDSYSRYDSLILLY
ncbi:hypothetical protein, partial [Phocaeicola vulgatus]|uniref:hypothetical protein n=1 Tax=Phocaeicola vulgatus TaxID=821 RepID=UPI001C87E78E